MQEMEKLCSRKLKITAKETMNIAEKLYTKGFISYPRTETNIFPSSVDLNHLIQQQTQDPNWGGTYPGFFSSCTLGMHDSFCDLSQINEFTHA